MPSVHGTVRRSMALYAVSVIPLINKCRDTATMDCNPATQVWYADDAAAGGSLKALHRFWNLLTQHGPSYGYFPKSSKSFLVTKPGHRGDAEHIFSSTGIQFTDNGQDLKHKAGQRHLGAAVGSAEYVAAYLDQKVASWSEQVIRCCRHPTTRSLCRFCFWTTTSLDFHTAHHANNRPSYAAAERRYPTPANALQPSQASSLMVNRSYQRVLIWTKKLEQVSRSAIVPP